MINYSFLLNKLIIGILFVIIIFSVIISIITVIRIRRMSKRMKLAEKNSKKSEKDNDFEFSVSEKEKETLGGSYDFQTFSFTEPGENNSFKEDKFIDNPETVNNITFTEEETPYPHYSDQMVDRLDDLMEENLTAIREDPKKKTKNAINADFFDLKF